MAGVLLYLLDTHNGCDLIEMEHAHHVGGNKQVERVYKAPADPGRLLSSKSDPTFHLLIDNKASRTKKEGNDCSLYT